MAARNWAEMESDSDQEPLGEDWFMTEAASADSKVLSRNHGPWFVTEEAQAKDTATDEAKTDVVMVESGTEVQLRKRPPKEVR